MTPLQKAKKFSLFDRNLTDLLLEDENSSSACGKDSIRLVAKLLQLDFPLILKKDVCLVCNLSY